MKRIQQALVAGAAAGLCVALSSATSARADGAMMGRAPGLGRDLPLAQRLRAEKRINESHQTAILFFRDGKEELIISPRFEDADAEFAWVMPVPSRPNVGTAPPKLFDELARLVAERLGAISIKPGGAGGAGGAGGSGPARAAPPVTVLEHKVVGEYTTDVLSATDGRALFSWLENNGYALPPQAVGPIQAYVREGWTFVACRVTAGTTGSGRKTGNLTPLHLSFDTKRPIYPMRLSAANPTPFSVALYLILPTSELGKTPDEIALASGPKNVDTSRSTRRDAVLPAGLMTRFRNLVRLGRREELQVFREEATVEPKNCTSDYVWAPPARPSRSASR